MHTSPVVFVIVGLILGVGLVAYGRRSEIGQRRSNVVMVGVLGVVAVLLAIDFATTPGGRWVSGIGLLGALGGLGGYGYQRFRGSKTHSG